MTYLQKFIVSQQSSEKDENVGICKGTCNLLRNFDAKNRGVKILFYFFSKVCRLCIATVERKRWNLMLQIVCFVYSMALGTKAVRPYCLNILMKDVKLIKSDNWRCIVYLMWVLNFKYSSFASVYMLLYFFANTMLAK